MLRDTYIWLAAPMCEVAQPQVGLFSRQDQTWAGFIFTDTRCWSWCEVEIDNRPKTGKTFPAASRALRWGPGELFDTSAACEEHLGSRPATETLLKSFGGHSGAPRPHWWRWRCHLPSRRDCLLPISVSSPLQCQSATLRRTCILSHLSSDRNSVTEPYYSFSFEFWEILTIPFLLNRWSSIHHLQSHVPPSKEKIEIAFSNIQLFIFFTLSHLREISKSKSGSELQAFPHQRLWMSFVGDCGLYKEQPSDHFWKIKHSKKYFQFQNLAPVHQVKLFLQWYLQGVNLKSAH